MKLFVPLATRTFTRDAERAPQHRAGVRPRRSNTRGASFVECLLLVAVVALAGGLIFSAFRDGLSGAATRAGALPLLAGNDGPPVSGAHSPSDAWLANPGVLAALGQTRPTPDVSPLGPNPSPSDLELSSLQRRYAAASPEERVALLADPRVQAALDAALAQRFALSGYPTPTSPELRAALLRGEDFRKDGGGDQAVIEFFDHTIGKSLVDTPFEKKLLSRWLTGDGSPYVLSDAELHSVQASDKAQAVGTFIRVHGAELLQGRQSELDGEGSRIRLVTLADGTLGFKVNIDFNEVTSTAPGDPLDGSIGKAQAFYDTDGNLVGVKDSYDFSNDNLAAHGINAFGSARPAGVHNYLVTGGLVGIDPGADLPVPRTATPVNVPADPQRVSSFGSLVVAVDRWATDKVKHLLE